MAHSIFVIGMDDFNRSRLDRIQEQSDLQFHGLFTLEHIRERQAGDAGELLEEAKRTLDEYANTSGNTVDGVIAYWDFPVQTMLPILRSRYGSPGPSLESVLRCEHKYWSRVQQKRVIPELVPEFQWFDPFDDAREGIQLDFPYWVKPVKATNSQLGFMVRDEHDLGAALEEIRAQIGRFGHWFDQFLDLADLPPEIERVRGSHCVAESILAGSQHTLSGWVGDDCIRTYGVVDSHNYPDRSSFSRHQYPSSLPPRVKHRMAGASAVLMESLDFQHEVFTIEFFYDRESDRLAVLKVNPRISQSHGDLYDKVDGCPNQKIAADLSLGRRPEFPYRKGRYALGAKFFLRVFEDAVVVSAPSASRIRQIEREIEGAIVDLRVREGDRLAEIPDRDSYSFELAHIYLGADTEYGLLAKYDRCVELLDIDLRVP